MRINDIEYIEVEVLDVRAAEHATEAFSLILTDRHNVTRYVPFTLGTATFTLPTLLAYSTSLTIVLKLFKTACFSTLTL